MGDDGCLSVGERLNRLEAQDKVVQQKLEEMNDKLQKRITTLEVKIAVAGTVATTIMTLVMKFWS